MGNLPLIFIIMGTVLGDRLSKMWVTGNFQIGESVQVLPGLHWTFILNRGAAFGLWEGRQWLMMGVAAVLLLVLIVFWRRLREQNWCCQGGIMLLAGGALGNLWDRFSLGAVIDFIDLGWWPIFNVADMGICLGGAMVVVSELWMKQEEKFL